jgi:copper homeostasis protein
MAKLLEVIVTSVQDAIEAEVGGADRLELVRDLEVGGLTPSLELVNRVLAAVALPVRVMLREQASMSAGGMAGIALLTLRAEEFSRLPIDGIVAGFTEKGKIDRTAMSAVIQAAPHCAITFHRAFDELADPAAAINELKEFAQVDRILTIGGSGDWKTRKQRLQTWQKIAAPEIALLVGAGLSPDVLMDLRNGSGLQEFHIGRAARRPQTVFGAVHRDAVRQLRTTLK